MTTSISPDEVSTRDGHDRALVQAVVEAIALAQASVGATAPNPPVGCVVLNAGGQTIASAAHYGAGTPHAAEAALAICRDAGRLEDADTLVVTLEPSNHHGPAGPSTEAILASPVRRVIFGVADPIPLAAGRGRDRLQEAGIECVALCDALPSDPSLVERCDDLIAPFAKRCRDGLPWVTVKEVRDRLGGRVPPPGRNTLSSAASLDYAHRLRRQSDAIVTGVGTILAAAPLMTVRRVQDHPNRRRRLVIMDRTGRTPASYLDAARDRGLDPSIRHDMETVVRELARDGCLRVLVEAGPRLTDAILNTPLWDDHVLIRRAPTDASPDLIDVFRRRAMDAAMGGDSTALADPT